MSEPLCPPFLTRRRHLDNGRRTSPAAVLTACLALVWAREVRPAPAPSPTQPVWTESSGKLLAQFPSDRPTLQDVTLDGEPFHRLVAPGAARLGEPGGPELPAWTRWVETLADSAPRLSISFRAVTTLSGVHLAPVSDLAADLPASGRNPRPTADPELYGRDLLYPDQVAQVSPPVLIGGKWWSLLTVTPFQYNPARRELRVWENLRVEVQSPSVPAPPEAPLAPVRRELHRLIDDQPARDQYPGRLDNLGRYIFVIPDNDDVEDALAPLIEWKTRKGFVTSVVRRGEIAGDATASAIRAYLMDLWEDESRPPMFVLLVGDGNGDQAFRLPYFDDNLNPSQGWWVSDNHFVAWTGDPDGSNDVDGWIPEGFIGRLPIRNLTDLNHMVAKILDYERDPFTDNPWVQGAVLIADGVHSCIQTNQAVRALMLEASYDRQRIYEAYGEYHAGQHPDLNIVNQGVNTGVGFVNFRGYNTWGYYTPDMISQRSNTRKLPVVTGMVCATNEFSNQHNGYGEGYVIGEAWVRAWNNGPTGAVACFGPTDLYTHTWFNNTMDAAFYHALLHRGVYTLGALCVGAKLALVKAYPSALSLGNGTSVGYYFHTYTLLGDPTLQVWTHDPQPMRAHFAAEVPRGTNLLEFEVTDDDDRPVAGAYVHAYLNDDVRFGGLTGDDGLLKVAVPPLPIGAYSLTVTAPGRVPVRESFQVAQTSGFVSPVGLEVDDDNEGQSRGNGDGTPNPGERLELTVRLQNWGTQRLDAFSGVLASSSPWVQIHQNRAEWPPLDPDHINYGTPFVLSALSDAPDGIDLDFELVVSHGDDQWRTSFSLPLEGFRFAVRGFGFDRDFGPGAERRLTVVIANAGTLDAADLLGTLSCDNPFVQVRRHEARFGALAAGAFADNADQPFLVFAPAQAYLGSPLNFTLDLRDARGRGGAVTFTTTLGPVSAASPQGPDAYGYYVFDPADTAAGMAPRYQWQQGIQRVEGLTDMDDRANPAGAHGSVAVVRLPFEFTYYGTAFREITIGSNGWLAFGRHDQIAWNNQPLGSPLAPGGMLAPFWDDLWNAQVYTLYQEDEARFLVEWRYASSAQGTQINFEVILYDPTVFPTRTGDGEFVFQYSNIPNLQGRDYAEEQTTIGICSPDRRHVLQVTHGRQWDPRTPRVANGTALRFSTGPFTETGSLAGRVTEAAGGAPMERVRISLDGTGLFGFTGADGSYRINRIPVGEYSVTAYRLHFNEANAAEVIVREGQTAQVDFALTHPVFGADTREILYGRQPGDSGSVAFTVWNDGNGPLDYRLRLNPAQPGMPRLAEWDSVFAFNATAAAPGYNDNFLRGLTYDGEFIYVSGPIVSREFPHAVYVYDRQGRLNRVFEQFTYDSAATRGYGDLSWNGRNLLAIERTNVLEITTQGELVNVIATPLRNPQALVWVPERNSFFIAGITDTEILEMTADGAVVNRFPTGGLNPYLYGLAWHPEDRDGFNLYIFGTERGGTPAYQLQIFKMDLATGDLVNAHNFPGPANHTPLSCTITKYWDPIQWCLLTLVNDPEGDRVEVHSLGYNLTWIRPSPLEGSVPPGERRLFEIGLFSEGLPERTYNVTLEILHNAEGDRWDIPIQFIVDRNWTQDDRPPATLSTFDLEAPCPNPFNAAVRLSFRLPQPSPAVLTIWDLHGRLVDQIPLGRLEAGRHTAVWNGAARPSGVYLVRLEYAGGSAARKMVLLK